MVSVDVVYVGDFEFELIDGIFMFYVVNMNEQVIQVGVKYYVLQNGVWFVGDSLEGLFQVVIVVLEEIYIILLVLLVYNVIYVWVYEIELNVVWYGYIMGYLMGFLVWGVFVYGIGWYYWFWYWLGIWLIYFLWLVIFGIGVFYNLICGIYGWYGYVYGLWWGIVGGGIYNFWIGGYICGVVISGLCGSVGFIFVYNLRIGNWVVVGGV